MLLRSNPITMSDSEDSGSDDRNEMGDGHGHAFVLDEAEESGEEGTDGDDESGGDGWEDEDDEPDLESDGHRVFNLMGPRVKGELPSSIDGLGDSDSDDNDDDDDSEEDSELDREEDGEDEADIDKRWERSAQKIMDFANSADFEFYDEDSDVGTDYDFGAYDSSDSWDNNVIETPGGTINTSLDIKLLTKRLRFFDGREKNPGTRSFPMFGQLPAELRLRIWEMYCSELRRKQRVIQVYVQREGRLTPAVTMDQQTKAVRQLMSISRETRAMGLKALPDVLPVGHSKYDKAVIRFDAETDLIHFMDEHPFGINAVGASELGSIVGNIPLPDVRVERSNRVSERDVPEPYLSVRNLAIGDCEQRSREPGAYHDHYFDQSVIELVSVGDASHRHPHELRGQIFLDSIELLFPNVQNVYVAEDGAFRKSDRWAGHIRSYQRYHVKGYEMDEYEGNKEVIEYMYCWHAPPKNARRTSKGAITDGNEAGSKGAKKETLKGEKEDEEEDDKDGENKGGDSDKTNDDDTATIETRAKTTGIPGDFKDGCIINHFASLHEKGVRFSRLLFFENEGMEDYWLLQAGCRPDGHWPNDMDGHPEQDRLPARLTETDAAYGWSEEDEDDEDEDDSMIDDDSLGEDESGSGDAEDWEGLDVLGSSDDDNGGDADEAPPLAAMFSSPEPEPKAAAETTAVSRGKKRRVVSDSDDEDEEDAEPSKKSKTSGGPAKRQRRTAVVSSDDEDDDDAGKDGSSKSDDSSSHTEAGENDDEDEEDRDEDEDEDEQPTKPLTLMQRLQQNREANPVSDEEGNSNEDDEDAEEAAGDYGEGSEDDEEEE